MKPVVTWHHGPARISAGASWAAFYLEGERIGTLRGGAALATLADTLLDAYLHRGLNHELAPGVLLGELDGKAELAGGGRSAIIPYAVLQDLASWILGDKPMLVAGESGYLLHRFDRVSLSLTAGDLAALARFASRLCQSDSPRAARELFSPSSGQAIICSATPDCCYAVSCGGSYTSFSRGEMARLASDADMLAQAAG